MKLVLLFVLCGIATAAAEPYGTNFTFLESKMIGGIDKPNNHVNRLMKASASIQINGKHTWTGGFYQKIRVFTTAHVAMEIDRMLKTPNPECTLAVCYQLDSGRKKCHPVRDVAVHKKFLEARKPESTVFPFDPYDCGILEVKEELGADSPTTWDAVTDSPFNIPGGLYYVIGWESKQDSDQRVVKFMEVERKNYRKCAESYNVDYTQLPFKVECLEPKRGQSQFQKEDLGAVVIYHNHAIGILSHVGENGKPAIMSRLKNLPDRKLSDDWQYLVEAA